MERLTGPVQHYAWGSTTAIPELLGLEPDGQPYAELWLGAHPKGPADVAGVRLDQLIASHPGVLGAASVARFGERLPYLMKVLAAARPLSLQAHPSRAQAEAGFAREEAAGIPRDADHRNYKDDWPKPEVLCALGDFEALYGFADPSAVAQHFARLGVAEVAPLVAPLTDPGGAEGIARVFLGLCELDNRGVVDAVVAAARESLANGLRADEPFGLFCRTAVELAEHEPGQPGVIAALLMNRMRLRAGEAIFLPAGNLHAYLHGTGVEIMANSDNVLRGGLTPKHVDVAELGRVLDFSPVAPSLVPVVEESPGVFRYQTPAPEFRLWRLELGGGSGLGEVAVPGDGFGRVLLVTDGEVEVGGVRLARGESGWLPAGEQAVLSGVSGRGQVFLGAPGLG